MGTRGKRTVTRETKTKNGITAKKKTVKRGGKETKTSMKVTKGSVPNLGEKGSKVKKKTTKSGVTKIKVSTVKNGKRTTVRKKKK